MRVDGAEIGWGGGLKCRSGGVWLDGGGGGGGECVEGVFCNRSGSFLFRVFL